MDGQPAAISRARIRRIGFVSTRIAGTDGVSLETHKWTTVLNRLGYECIHIAGELDRRGSQAEIIPTAAFTHPAIVDIQKQCFGPVCRTPSLSRAVHAAAQTLKEALHRCQEKFRIDLWIIENAVSIPMNIPLGLALTEFLSETCLPAIAHHHDFLWERERFATSGVGDYLHTAFPPKLPGLRHVVINSVAQVQLSYRLGTPSTLIPNVMDFEHAPTTMDPFTADLRQNFGVGEGEWLILQPTRVVPRKKIEYTIELIKRLDDPRSRLVVTHAVTDEGPEYVTHVQNYAKLLGVPIRLVHDWIGPQRQTLSAQAGHKLYTISDAYACTDLVAYPSEYEGFGNAFLEAIYHRQPIVCNRYSIYRTDIEPKGFDVITMDGFVSEATVAQTRAVLTDPARREQMVAHNFELGRQFFSFAVLEQKLKALLADIAGVS